MYSSKVPSRLCDKTNVRLMWRYDCSMVRISSEFTSFTPIYVETVTEPEPSSARNVGGIGAAYGPHAARCSLGFGYRDESNRAPSFEIPNSTWFEPPEHHC